MHSKRNGSTTTTTWHKQGHVDGKGDQKRVGKVEWRGVKVKLESGKVHVVVSCWLLVGCVWVSLICFWCNWLFVDSLLYCYCCCCYSCCRCL